MKPFAFARPADVDEAVRTVAAEPEAVFLAGGTNLVDHLKLGVARPDLVVDVRTLTSREITELPDGGLRLGAASTNSEVAGATGQLRNLATTGGNPLQRTRCVYFQDVTLPCNKREPGSGCSAVGGYTRYHAVLGVPAALPDPTAPETCIATHPSDMAVALAALDAQVQVLGPTGARTVPFVELHRLPGEDPSRDTVLEHGELITAVDVPAPPSGARSTYRKVRDRASYAFALVSVAAVLEVADGRVRDVRIALGGAAHKPWRAARAEEVLRGGPATPDAYRAAAEAELAAAQPQAGLDGGNGFKIPLLTRTLVATLRELTPEARGMTDLLQPREIGRDHARRDGAQKVRGTATYAYETPVENPVFAWIVQSTIARGRITAVDTTAAQAIDGVLAVLTTRNAERLASTDDAGLAVLQDDEIAFRGQPVAVVVATTSEVARQAAELVTIGYDEQPHDAELRADRDDLYKPEVVNPSYETDTSEGDVEAAMASAPVTLDRTYSTAMYHNNPIEPHATTALWDTSADIPLTLWDSTQGVHPARAAVAQVFGLEEGRIRVVCPFVGGGFGSKGTPHAHVVLAAMAARALPGRPVKLALTRQQMFFLAGYRTPTIQRMQLASDRSGSLAAIAIDVVEQTSRIKEFAEQTGVPTRMMYAAPNRRTTHRLAALDVPVPSWMRAPGECPGMFGPEVALDELAEELGIDPVQLRIRNEPEVDPETGKPWSSRHLVECLQEGARRFGWHDRDARPAVRRDGDWLVGTGVASSVYPTMRQAQSTATIRFEDGRYVTEIGAADLGTGAWTVLPQITADALGVGVDQVDVRIGDTAYPIASVAGGSSGTNTWGSAIVVAARAFRDKFGGTPSDGDEVDGDVDQASQDEEHAAYAFGAQFAEARVNVDTGEIRVPRLLGVFAAGRIINPRTARSQFIGGMTMGLSMALHETSVMDPRIGQVANHDLAEYHITVNADLTDIEAHWLDEDDPYVNAMGSKGIGEIGITGTAAAVVNAVHHATGVRVRDLPVTLDKLLPGLPPV